MNIKTTLFQFFGIKQIADENIRELLALAEEQTISILESLDDQLEYEYDALHYRHYQNEYSSHEDSINSAAVDNIKAEIDEYTSASTTKIVMLPEN
ncbi:MAG: hypothetical protein ACWIPH_09000 [Ostreibacterium sp.]